MYNPCLECYNRYGRQYTEECDEMCEYANILSKLKPYSNIDEIVRILKGNSFPLVLIDDKHINSTYRIVCAAKNGFI